MMHESISSAYIYYSVVFRISDYPVYVCIKKYFDFWDANTHMYNLLFSFILSM